jgi:Fic family protein
MKQGYCSIVSKPNGLETAKATATRDLNYLVTHGILVLQGRTGRGSRYVLKGS